jgi:hypothetical protein
MLRVCCLFAALGAGLGACAAGAATMLEVRIAVSADDAEQSGTTGAVDTESNDLELVKEGGASQTVGLRFPGLALPAGATIQAAWVQFETDEIQTGAASLTLQGDLSEEPGPFLPTAGDVSGRPRTAASVVWSPPDWLLIGEQGPDQRTPSLADVVQELVDAPHWTSGDAVSLIVTGSGRRTARSFEGLPTGAPLLHVEFDPPANHRPPLAITSPLRGTTTFAGSTVSFSASAVDVESGDVSADIGWTSSLDGVLGVGPAFTRSDLSPGLHLLTASVSDGQGGLTTRTRALTVYTPGNQLVAAGDIGDCSGSGDDATGKRVETLPGAILGLGDYAYPDGSASDFASCYDPSWGRHEARTLPVAGNHEYETDEAAPYFAYFGASAGTLGAPWRSFDYAGWHIVALDSNCRHVGGCDAGSPQAQWLEADLAAHSNPCTLAYFHHPRFASGYPGIDDALLPFWQILYAHGVDVILNGHDHAYERFARMGPNGIAEPLRGPRSFVVGSGGAGLDDEDELEVNREARDSTTYGVLQLTLAPTSYGWEFAGAGPGTFTDAGSEECVYEAPVVTITSPVAGTVFPARTEVVLSGTASDLEQGSLDSSLVWTSSRDGVLGTGASLTRVLSTGGHVLTASVSDEMGLIGSAQVSVTVLLPPGASCGIGPELVPLLALLGGAASLAQRSGSRGTPKRSR